MRAPFNDILPKPGTIAIPLPVKSIFITGNLFILYRPCYNINAFLTAGIKPAKADTKKYYNPSERPLT